jgi:hypothetical protein
MNTEEIRANNFIAEAWDYLKTIEREKDKDFTSNDVAVLSCIKAFSAGLEEGKKQVYEKSDTSYTYNKTCEKLGRKVVYDIAYNQACEDIFIILKVWGYDKDSPLWKDIRKLQEGKNGQ